MANRKIKESLGKTKFSTTLKNISGDKVIATADTIADLSYNTTLADGTVTEGAYQSEVNKLHADAIEELKKSKTNVSFNPKDITYDEIMKAFEFADNIDTSNYSTIIIRGVLDDEGKETDVLDCTPITVENCTYVVKRTFTLNQDLVLPKNSCLCFEGGHIKSEENHWITGVFEPSSKFGAVKYQSSFTIQNNTCLPIISENVFIDIPYDCKFNRSWFISDVAFFGNAEAVIQLERDFMIIGVFLYLDTNQLTYDISSSRDFNFSPLEDKYKMSPLVIRIFTPVNYTVSITGSFLFSPYRRDDENEAHYNWVILFLNNVNFTNSCASETLIMGAYLENATFTGHNRVITILGVNSLIVLNGNTMIPEYSTCLSGVALDLESKCNVYMESCTECTVNAPIIRTKGKVFKYNTCIGDFQPGNPCVISHCIFDTLDVDTYYSDEAEEKGIYFYNSTLNNTTLDSYNRFKVIE